jgi:hypothetical protein
VALRRKGAEGDQLRLARKLGDQKSAERVRYGPGDDFAQRVWVSGISGLERSEVSNPVRSEDDGGRVSILKKHEV